MIVTEKSFWLRHQKRVERWTALLVLSRELYTFLPAVENRKRKKRKKNPQSCESLAQTLSCNMLLLLRHFSRVRLCATPETAAHQAPPSLGFSRQERWSGLPFPSPTHESEKWEWSRSVVSNSSRPHGLQPTRLLHPWDFPGKSTGVGYHCLLCYQLYY